jgi:hypothetical protein
MRPRMSNSELDLFECFLRCAGRYLEFGTGGSTCLAAATVSGSVWSVDSSRKWQADVENHCKASGIKKPPKLLYVDIGPVGDWGAPLNQENRGKWADYHSKIWQNPSASDCDLYMVDGRFRVACFMQIVLYCHPHARIMIHDFASRSYYRVVKHVATEVARAGDLSVFHRSEGDVSAVAREILTEFTFNYA